MRILFSGKEWLGSNAVGLARGFRELGHLVHLVNEDCYYPAVRRQKPLHAVLKMLKPFLIREFNAELLEQDDIMQPDLVVIFKGTFVHPDALRTLKKRGRPVVLFYPDVSVFGQGGLIPRCIGLYDHIFSTKTFMAEDLRKEFGIEDCTFLPHGADSSLHRKLPYDPEMARVFASDVSFIGQYTVQKERILSALAERLPEEVTLKIWGPNWQRNSSGNLRKHICHQAPHGDLFVAAINYSKINLALLQEKKDGASSGDLITSRTFHIPASGGFMLHERTEDYSNFFRDKVEADSFETVEELVEKVCYYLTHETERLAIAKQGYLQTHKVNMLCNRADAMLAVCRKKGVLKE